MAGVVRCGVGCGSLSVGQGQSIVPSRACCGFQAVAIRLFFFLLFSFSSVSKYLLFFSLTLLLDQAHSSRDLWLGTPAHHYDTILCAPPSTISITNCTFYTALSSRPFCFHSNLGDAPVIDVNFLSESIGSSTSRNSGSSSSKGRSAKGSRGGISGSKSTCRSRNG